MAKQTKQSIASIAHRGVRRKNIPTAEMEKLVPKQEAKPKTIPHRHNPKTYHRDPDLDPQLVWHGKDAEDMNGLSVDAHPIYVHEHIHPKVIIDDLKQNGGANNEAPSLFETWTGGLSPDDRVEFYAHQQPWTNRFILGDSLLVMQSLAEKEGMKKQVQCIYMDPPYGIKFSSNWQPSTKSHKARTDAMTGEPEMIKAYRDTWEKGIHSYLSYLRDRLIISREMLTESGSIFMQISEENLHLVRTLMDEVFGKDNFITQIYFATTSGFPTKSLSRIGDYLLWFAKNKEQHKFNPLCLEKAGAKGDVSSYKDIELPDGVRRKFTKEERTSQNYPVGRIFGLGDMCGQGAPKEPTPLVFQGKSYDPTKNSHWKANYPNGTHRLIKANRVAVSGSNLKYVRYLEDYPAKRLANAWLDTGRSFASDKRYVVETSDLVIQRCILMTTDPGDLVLDPTCGSGTTAYVAEKFGRRWITIDASRVAISLARSRLMGGKFDWYLLQDSKEGAAKESELGGESSVTRRNLGGGATLHSQPTAIKSAMALSAAVSPTSH